MEKQVPSREMPTLAVDRKAQRWTCNSHRTTHSKQMTNIERISRSSWCSVQARAAFGMYLHRERSRRFHPKNNNQRSASHTFVSSERWCGIYSFSARYVSDVHKRHTSVSDMCCPRRQCRTRLLTAIASALRIFQLCYDMSQIELGQWSCLDHAHARPFPELQWVEGDGVGSANLRNWATQTVSIMMKIILLRWCYIGMV